VQALDHADVFATREAVTAAVLHGGADVDLAVRLIEAAEAQAGVPLVDESERARLEALADGRRSRPDHWHSLLARTDGRAVGYAGLILPERPGDDGVATGDVAIAPGAAPPATLAVLLASLTTLGRRHDAERVRVWLRHAHERDVVRAAAAGYCVDRRLAVMQRSLDADLRQTEPPGHVRVRPFADADADAVVAVLDAAYAGTPDGGWTRADFDRRRGYDWFRPADLLVAATADDEVVGVHWTKRRGNREGEVYNLAVSPDGQGAGLGATLLEAGLVHLRDVGCDRVVLWVDLANERALRLYASHGFEVRWEDVAFGHHLDREPVGPC
jgi:mycothiol synthase